MFASLIVTEFRRVSGFRNLGLRDISDHLSTQGTFVVCMVLTAILSTTTFYLNPLTCVLVNSPDPVKETTAYVTDYCWTHGTIPDYEIEDHDIGDKASWTIRDEKERVSYYQWMPLYISLMGILSVLPSYVWQAISDSWMSSDYERGIQCAQKAVRSHSQASIKAGLDEAAGTFHTMFSLFQPKATVTLPKDRDQSFSSQCCRCLKNFVFFRRSISFTRFLSYGYGIYKLSILLMALLQMFILVSFLRGYAVGNFFTFLPFLLKNIIDGHEWAETGVFPRRGFCVVNLTYLGVGDNQFLAQCTLTMNMLNEKLCIFLWFWFTLLVILNFCGILWWISALSFQRSKIEFLRHYLNKLPEEMKMKSTHFTDKQLQGFVNNYLHEDGMFVLRMLKRDAGSWACALVVLKLWKLYHETLHDDIPSYSEACK